MEDKVLAMMEMTVYDSVVECPFCEYGPLEADYDVCPECEKKNPLQSWGFI